MSLGAKLNLFLLSFLVLLGAATSAIIIFGFNRTQDSAQERSNEALEEQGKLALQAVVGGVSDSGGLQIEWAAEIGHRASRYLDEFKSKGGVAEYDVSRFVRTENGVWYDPDPRRASDVVVPNHVEQLTAAHLDDIAYSAALDALLPALAEGFPGQLSGEGFRPFAVIFVGVQGVGRYYPPIGIQDDTPADLDISDFFDRFGPVANPGRETTWTPPYEDLNGRGLVITAQTPIYEGEVFRGIFEVDLSIDKLVEELNEIRPTEGGFAFYVDTEGDIMRSDAFALLDRESSANPQLAAILEGMKAPSQPPGSLPPVERVTLDGEAYFLAYAPMPAVGGSIAAAAPVDEVTANAALVTAGIDEEGQRTVRFMLAAMGGLFVAGLGAATYLNRRLLVAPLRQLGAATRQVAGGDLSASVSVNRNDELGALASDFNVMVEQLRESERVLEQRVEDRTRELGTLLEVSRSVASNIELDPLLDSVLDQVRTVAEYDRGSVQVFEDGMFTVRAVRDFGAGRGYQTQLRPGMQFPVLTGPAWSQFEEHEPIIINDIKGDSPLAGLYRDLLHPDVDAGAIPDGSFMAVPLISQDTVVGRISIGRDVTGFYTSEHARLARAIASQVATAIINARLFEETQRRARETEALLRADGELFRSLDLDAVLQALVDVAVDVLGVDKSIVVLHQGDIDVVRAARNYAPDNIAAFNRVIAAMPHEEPPPEDQTPQVYVDATQAPEFVRDRLAAEGIASHISVPVRDASRMLGAFGVSFVVEHVFTDEEERLYIALADRAAVAIQNAELYERAQHAASLEERQRLARELHDSVSQALYGIALGARTARLRIDENPASAAEPIDYVTSLAEAGLAEMRALIFELRPESLETEGLVAAIEKQIASTRARHQIAIDADLMDEPDCRLDTKEALYRIAQEALHNVVKHAQATHINVHLGREELSLVLVVADDGRGFDTSKSFPGQLGLHSMPERASKLGGEVAIESSPGDGTRVTARLPV